MIRLVILAGLAATAAACSDRGGNASMPATATANVASGAGPEASGPTEWQTTPSGMRYRRLSGDGLGPRPRPADTVTIHYVGKLADGTEFDSSFNSGAPVTMALPDLIPGWQEGVPLMSVGDVYEFVVPPALGYGPEGGGPIPPNATLHFTIGLIDIVS